MAAYRLYSKAAPGRFHITLAHGSPDQRNHTLFEDQHLIWPLRGSALDQLRFIHKGRAWIKQHANEFDVLHGLQGFELTVQPALQAELLGLPSVVKIAAYRSDLADKRGVRGLLGIARRRRKKVGRLSAVIATSQDIVGELRAYAIPHSLIAHIPNCVDMTLFRPADRREQKGFRQQLGWPDRPTILFSGRLNRRKRPHLLLEALSQVLKRGLDCQLVLAGPPGEYEYTQQMRRYIKEQDIATHIMQLGFVADMAPLYSAADVFALPSSSEGMPNALLEAMASGLPALATRISGISDLVDNKVHGRLVAPSAEDLADAIVVYLNDPAIRQKHAVAARKRIETLYSTEVALDAHEELFRRLIEKKSLPS